ncbi:MAG: tetratricopeptide repeat protein, partial [Cyclobacteriaceae bacterium]|nr:tetratricopeptide repeat protein [Cyclobacteriaceae bacterium]
MKWLISLVLLLIIHQAAVSQADSLENLLKTAKGPDKVKVMNELFRAYIKSDPVKALGYTREALTLASSIDDSKGMGACYNNLGVAYKEQGALDLALANYLRALDIYTQLQNVEGIATSKNNIANIYSLKKNYAQALTYFEESRLGFVALGANDKIVGSLNNLGNLHSDLQMYDKAITYYSDSWKMSEKAGTEFADPLTNIGNLFYRQGNYQRAAEYYNRALAIVRKQNDKASELSILANMGELFVKASQPGKAQGYLDSALVIAADLGSRYMLPQILKSMASNYAKQGKMKDAYDAMLKYDASREKIYGEESSRRIAQMDVALQLKEKEDAIHALQLDDQNKTLKLRNAQFIIIAAVLGVITTVAVFNLSYIKRKRKT